jgi:ribokinase
MSLPQIIVLGSVNTDLVVRAPELPVPGETVQGGEFYQASGGKGANQAVAAARLSREPVGFIAAVGQDTLGREAIKSFRRENLVTNQIRMIDGQPTGVALIMVDETGQNQISVAAGANACLTPDDVAAVDDSFFQAASVFVTSLESPLESVLAGLRRAKSAGLTTILNPAPACTAISTPEILQLADVLTPNESEATLISGWDTMDDLEDVCIWCEQLEQRGSRRLIITRGERGCVLKDETSAPALSAAFQVQAVDTTAAGDCFNGALAVRLAEGATLSEAARFAQAAAALSVTRRGAMPSLPKRSEVDGFLADAPDLNSIYS